MTLNKNNAHIINYYKGELNSSLILSSPHSGNYYPKEFLLLSQVDIKELSQNEDSLVDLLLNKPLENQNVLLKAKWSRSVVDVNRSINDFTKQDFKPPIKNLIPSPTKYARSGLGVIPSRSGLNDKIYKSSISGLTASKWLEQAWKSYHSNLNMLLQKSHEKFDHYILFDFHSMPSSINNKHKDPDIVLGDCHGRTIEPKIINFIEEYFVDNGLTVNRNTPYSGGYITEYYGKPIKNSHSVQIEINRSLYLNEKTRNKNSNFENCRNLLINFINLFEKNKTKFLK